jgi:ABC-type branched-subunit amino acid transport system ATPase component
MAYLEMRGITKAFPNVLANDGIDLAIERGEIHALVGENGAGKTTLMRILYGMERADAGTIALDGRVVRISGPQQAAALGIGMGSTSTFNSCPRSRRWRTWCSAWSRTAGRGWIGRLPSDARRRWPTTWV